ncbi:MAG TPA: hypothetical protein VG897_13005 [Terriglobales bacterium]|nr:hypothetical protein [Terriglobales bacterium]
MGRKNKEGKYEGGCGIECRLYDMRHRADFPVMPTFRADAAREGLATC